MGKVRLPDRCAVRGNLNITCCLLRNAKKICQCIEDILDVRHPEADVISGDHRQPAIPKSK